MSVSVVVPTYGRPALLRRLLTSIAAQTYRHYEVVVVDDCSPNEHEYRVVLEQMAPLLPAFTFIRNAHNRGAPHSRNRGIQAARYDLVALVDDDDEWLPRKLERQIDVFANSSPKVGIVYTWTDVVEDGRRQPFYRAQLQGSALPAILHECFIPSPSVMARKTALLEAGLFDERLPSCQDWDMWTRLLALGYEARVVPEVLTLYHKHGTPSIGASANARSGYIQYYAKHFWKLLRFGEWRHLMRFARMVAGV